MYHQNNYTLDSYESQYQTFAEYIFQKLTKLIETETTRTDKPPLWQTWGIGLLIVTISAFASPAGILVTPLLNKKLYERIMVFLVALGIGALSGSIMFIMLPQAFKATADGDSYLAKSSIVLSALYGFFMIDRLLQFMLELKRKSRTHRIRSRTLQIVAGSNNTTDSTYSRTQPIVCGDDDFMAAQEIEALATDLKISEITNALTRRVSSKRCVPVIQTMRTRAATMRSRAATARSCTDIIEDKVDVVDKPTPKTNSEDETVSVAVTLVDEVVMDTEQLQIASIAYMIIFGSSANNFVDGMSNGVAFADSLVRGLSVGLACIAQQFPQELGTLAILINSGLGLKRTLILNLIPGALSYVGFMLGAVLDNNLEGADGYVFSVSSGMYCYVFLGTLIPEIRDSTNQIIKKNFKEGIIVTLLQFGGMLFGVVFMFCMAKFACKIHV